MSGLYQICRYDLLESILGLCSAHTMHKVVSIKYAIVWIIFMPLQTKYCLLYECSLFKGMWEYH